MGVGILPSLQFLKQMLEKKTFLKLYDLLVTHQSNVNLERNLIKALNMIFKTCMPYSMVKFL
jgi:hypothetical protein